MRRSFSIASKASTRFRRPRRRRATRAVASDRHLVMPCAFGESEGSPRRRRAERIDLRGEMSVAPEALSQVRGADDDEQISGCRSVALDGWINRSPGFEQRSRRGIDRFGVLSIALVHLDDVAEVHALNRIRSHCLGYRTQGTAHLNGPQLRSRETSTGHRARRHGDTLLQDHPANTVLEHRTVEVENQAGSKVATRK